MKEIPLMKPLLVLAMLLPTVPALGQDLTSFGIQVLQGPATPAEASTSQLVVSFFLAQGCPACEEFEDWNAGFSPPENTIHVLVTNEESPGLLRWAQRNPSANVWIDAEGRLARHLGVEVVPSMFLLRNERLVNVAVWPFASDFSAIERMIREFDRGAFGAPFSPDVSYLAGLDLSDVVLMGPGGEIATLDTHDRSRIVLLCDESCPYCRQEFEALSTAPDPIRHERMLLVLRVSNAEAKLPRPSEVSIGIPVLYDIHSVFEDRFDIPFSPTHLLLDEEGVVIDAIVGYHRGTLDEIESMLESAETRSSASEKGRVHAQR